MLSFNEFRLSEASENTKAQEIKLEIAKKFDEISEIKKSKKEGDVNSEVDGLNKQAAAYLQISNLMKSLSAEIKASAAKGGSTNIY
jgi:hypothetical protein